MTVFRSDELAFLLFCFSPFSLSLSLSLLSSSLIYCEIACETTVVCTMSAALQSVQKTETTNALRMREKSAETLDVAFGKPVHPNRVKI